MPAVWEQRFTDALQRLLSLRESTALDVLPDVMPVLPLIDAADPEVYRLRGCKLVSGGIDVTAAAAQFPTAYFGVPASNTNTLLVLRRFIVSVPVAQEVTFVNGVAPGGGISGLLSDDRRETSTTIQTQRASVSEVASFGGARRLLLPAGVPFVFDYPVVLDTGEWLAVQGQTAASRLVVIAMGYERTVQPAELK